MFCYTLPATHLVELRSHTQTWSILGVLRAVLILFPDEEVSWSLVHHSPQNTLPHACDVAIDVYIRYTGTCTGDVNAHCIQLVVSWGK